MKISIFGLGYVGVVTAACFARDGHKVIGVDVNPEKVSLITKGESPIIEPGLSELLKEGVNSNQIRATVDAPKAIAESDVSLISVGTPPGERGEPNLGYVFGVCKEIAVVAKNKEAHVVILRSTVPPGTLQKCQALFDEVAGPGKVHTVFNPEFLREGSAIKDYDNPPYTIIGTESKIGEDVVRAVYASVDAPVTVTKPAVAEMVKYVANTWHANKVSFANEIGRVAKAFGVDGRDVMGIITQDTKLNVSPVYMQPGFAYGGSCLPKDLGALIYFARQMDVPAPLLNSLPATNMVQIDLAIQEVLRSKSRRVAIFGLAFKPKTDDLRESPAVILVKQLLGEGCTIKIFDEAVYKARLMGTNLAYIQQNLPHFEGLLVETAEQALEGAEIAVLTHGNSATRDALKTAPSDLKVLDLSGAFSAPIEAESYSALGW
ncbi:MAG: UDP-glucose/GDP-mannose dehydrogenase family protein [Elainellaceae cyanobacterium]